MFKRKTNTALLDRPDEHEPEHIQDGFVDLTLESPKALRKKLNYLSFFVVGAGALAATNLLLTFGLLIFVSSLSNRQAPTLVELADGTSIRVKSVGATDRSPEAIKEFTASTMVRLFDWRGSLPPSRPEEIGAPPPDPGVDIGGGVKITTSTWAAGFAVSESFRSELLRAIAALTPKSLFGQLGTSRTQGVLVIRQVGEPIKKEAGVWNIDVVANLILFENGDNVGKAIPFNKTLTIQAIAPPKLPQNPTGLQTTIYESRKAGLEIDSMQDLRL